MVNATKPAPTDSAAAASPRNGANRAPVAARPCSRREAEGGTEGRPDGRLSPGVVGRGSDDEGELLGELLLELDEEGLLLDDDGEDGEDGSEVEVVVVGAVVGSAVVGAVVVGSVVVGAVVVGSVLVVVVGVMLGVVLVDELEFGDDPHSGSTPSNGYAWISAPALELVRTRFPAT